MKSDVFRLKRSINTRNRPDLSDEVIQTLIELGCETSATSKTEDQISEHIKSTYTYEVRQKNLQSLFLGRRKTLDHSPDRKVTYKTGKKQKNKINDGLFGIWILFDLGFGL